MHPRSILALLHDVTAVALVSLDWPKYAVSTFPPLVFWPKPMHKC